MNLSSIKYFVLIFILGLCLGYGFAKAKPQASIVNSESASGTMSPDKVNTTKETKLPINSKSRSSRSTTSSRSDASYTRVLASQGATDLDVVALLRSMPWREVRGIYATLSKEASRVEQAIFEQNLSVEEAKKRSFAKMAPLAENSLHWLSVYSLPEISPAYKLTIVLDFYDNTDSNKTDNVVAGLKSPDNLCWGLSYYLEKDGSPVANLAGAGGCGVGDFKDGVPYIALGISSKYFSNTVSKIATPMPPSSQLLYFDLRKNAWRTSNGSTWTPISEDEAIQWGERFATH